ncbi:hypothetical protein [Lacibacter sediminis]|uniref:HTH HARE-type domain-containing protein n=1 Tax=Lacibacter sediminis TaxID=2760713 RepID=A0A7G5XFP0_9BACT|nr:hypothetical protein [Lacibacter sediminis]QNA44293.1 hypothetical protein H4075_19860 [Lacibacter sediminis]
MSQLLLHEAIAVVLLATKNRSATIEEIANEINRRELYRRKDNTDLPSYQVMQRTKLSNGRYQHLFEWIEPNIVRLRNL